MHDSFVALGLVELVPLKRGVEWIAEKSGAALVSTALAQHDTSHYDFSADITFNHYPSISQPSAHLSALCDFQYAHFFAHTHEKLSFSVTPRPVRVESPLNAMASTGAHAATFLQSGLAGLSRQNSCPGFV